MSKYHSIPLKNISARVWYCFGAKFSNYYPLSCIVLFVYVRLNKSALIGHFSVSDCKSIVSKKYKKVKIKLINFIQGFIYSRSRSV